MRGPWLKCEEIEAGGVRPRGGGENETGWVGVRLRTQVEGVVGDCKCPITNAMGTIE